MLFLFFQVAISNTEKNSYPDNDSYNKTRFIAME